MAQSDENAHAAIVSDLLLTDALTGNSDGTPGIYTVHADDVEYLVETVLALAAGRAEQAAVQRAADEMAAVIAEGDIAEVAAPVPGEVGRSAVVSRRDALYEEPVEWLREYAAHMTIPSGSKHP